MARIHPGQGELALPLPACPVGRGVITAKALRGAVARPGRRVRRAGFRRGR